MKKEVIRKIIIENTEFIGEIDLFKRNIEIDGKANYIICGIRRCGKSFLQYQQINKLLKQHISEYIYINFEDERFVELLRRYRQDIYYYKRKYEVDFYLPEDQLLIQVSYSIDSIETKEREINALSAAMKELHISQALILTYDEEDSIENEGTKIEVMPVWKWLLKGEKA